MATATQLPIGAMSPSISRGLNQDAVSLYHDGGGHVSSKPSPSSPIAHLPLRGDSSLDLLLSKAIRLATLIKSALHTISVAPLPVPSFADVVGTDTPAAEGLLSLALDPQGDYRIPDELFSRPRRRSTRSGMAARIASLLYPVETDSLAALIRYEEDRVRVKAWVSAQRKRDVVVATKRNESVRWEERIAKQGVWDESKFAISKEGTKALPMLVTIAELVTLESFLGHLAANGGIQPLLNGGHQIQDGVDSDSEPECEGGPGIVNGDTLIKGSSLHHGAGEPYYGIQGLEFPRGVLYADGRLDLCKQVVGPDHIGLLMDSLRTNQFVKHFLLGNNIIGPVGANAIAGFIAEFPERMETWYLAGNCITGEGLAKIADALRGTKAVSNIWLKRNPLGKEAAKHLAKLVTGCPNLKTLDLDQTELGDEGVAEFFNLLSEHHGAKGTILPLKNIYLNGTGMSVSASKAIGRFLSTPHCALESIYLSCNPLGQDGALALAEQLPTSRSLKRLSLQSTGLDSAGAIAICEAVKELESIILLDLGQAYATQDLGQAYNYIDDDVVSTVASLLTQPSTSLAYFNLGHCAISSAGITTLANIMTGSQPPSILVFQAQSIFAPLYKLTSQQRHALSIQNLEIGEVLELNVRREYGEHVTYARFWEDEKRWLVSDREDVRKIDSVYRNRDMAKARRGKMVLAKEWEKGDGTLQRVMGLGVDVKGPVCTLKKGAA